MDLARGRTVVVGVDVGGTNMQFGVVDDTNALIGRARAKTEAESGLAGVLDRVQRGIEDACRAAAVTLEDVAAVGIAVAGAIDIPNGIVLTAPNLGWTDIPFRDLAQTRLACPVLLENDVNGAMWGEYQLGAGDGRGDALGVWIGTGVGGGLIIDGRLYHGAFHTAGEIGHTVILPDAPSGQRTIEDLCSRTGMRATLARELPSHPDSLLRGSIDGEPDRIGTAEIAAAFDAGDALTVRTVHRAADLLGIAIAGWVTVLALDRVIIGGGITEALGPPYLERIKQSFLANVFPERCRACGLTATKLTADAGLLGAALLARGAH